MPRPERRDPSPAELLAYVDGILADGQRASIAAALTASAASRERLRRLEETGRLLRAGTPPLADDAGRACLRTRLGAERAARRAGRSRRTAMVWRRPRLAVNLTAAALPARPAAAGGGDVAVRGRQGRSRRAGVGSPGESWRGASARVEGWERRPRRSAGAPGRAAAAPR